LNPIEIDNTAEALSGATTADVIVTACAFEPDQQRALAAG
jgi:hypothetical protein